MAHDGRRSRRARVVCRRCHDRKIRCDLATPEGTCSGCIDAASVCEFRPSRKGEHRKKAVRNNVPATQAVLSLGADSTAAADPATQDPPIDSGAGSYVRALLGHQSRVHGIFQPQDQHTVPTKAADDVFAQGLLQRYISTYSELCYVWCPIIDLDASATTTGLVLLDHCIAGIASTIRPTLLPGASSPREHYERARDLFHNERHHGTWTVIKAAMLLSCLDSSRLGSPMDNSFWWLGVAIRLSQNIRLHREPHNASADHDTGLKRRLWWSLFARERTIALCQGRPCMINEDDCNISLPQTTDFPHERLRESQIFMQWVSLSRIMGQVNSYMAQSRRSGLRIPTQDIAASLTGWLSYVPVKFSLPIHAVHTTKFSLDVHLLYLPYLTTVSLVYLNTTGRDLPEISVAAVLAAACTARIIRDILLSGSVRVLPEDSGWYIAVAITALMHVRPVSSLALYAADDIELLLTTLDHLGAVWSSARFLSAGLNKIRDRQSATTAELGEVEQAIDASERAQPTVFRAGAHSLNDLYAGDGVSWSGFFPFATVHTSPLVEAILTQCEDNNCLDLWPAFDFGDHFETLWNELATEQMVA